MPDDRLRGLRRMEPDRLAWIALAGLLVVGAAFIYYETRGTTPLADEWGWALERRGGGLDTFLKPHNEHFSLIPVALYKLLFVTAGLGNNGPYRAMVVAGHLSCVALVFVYAKRRVGSYLALLGAALLLFFGPGWQNILWPFQIGSLLSLGAGLGALLMLDRADRRGDVGACLLLGVSLASSGLGLAIALGVAVDLLWGGRRWRRAWIVAAPLALYALWWIGYGNAHNFVRHNIVAVPGYAADAAAAAISSLAGLTEAAALRPDTPLAWGRPLAVLAVVVLLWRLAATQPVPRRVVTLLAIVLSFWTLTALNRAQISTPFESRYVYVGAFFLLLLAVEVAHGTRLPRRARPLLAVAVAAAIVSNLGVLRDNARLVRSESQLVKADLAAVDIGRPVARRDLALTTFPAYPLLVVKVGPYLAAKKAIGSPASTPTELAGGTRGGTPGRGSDPHRHPRDPPAARPAGLASRHAARGRSRRRGNGRPPGRMCLDPARGSRARGREPSTGCRRPERRAGCDGARRLRDGQRAALRRRVPARGQPGPLRLRRTADRPRSLCSTVARSGRADGSGNGMRRGIARAGGLRCGTSPSRTRVPRARSRPAPSSSRGHRAPRSRRRRTRPRRPRRAGRRAARRAADRDLRRCAGERVAALHPALGAQHAGTAQDREELLEELHGDVAAAGQLADRHRSVTAAPAELGEGLQRVRGLGGDGDHGIDLRCRSYGTRTHRRLRAAAGADGPHLLPVRPARPELGARTGRRDRPQARPHGRVRAAVVAVVPRVRFRRPVLAAVITLAYAATDEFHQTFVHGRNGSPIDWGIDAAGVAVAWALTLRGRAVVSRQSSVVRSGARTLATDD